VIQERHITVRKTARYFVLEPDQCPTTAVLYVMHGYRQLGQYFIKQFQALADLGIKVIAPEGLHRFYIEGYSGRVGASWMTKESRETDIVDYINYLEDLHASLEDELSGMPVHLMGFSQGGPTACRWFAASNTRFASLVLYATVFPNDFDFEIQEERLKETACLIAFGDSDQFASESTIEEKVTWMKEKGVKLRLLRFIGGHEIKSEVLVRIWKEISEN
jgi:predicted esterase